MRKRTVLYIEDSGVERQIICRLLGSENVEVIAAGDAAEGIELARRFKPDLILLDLHLPDMDGRALAESLRGIPHLESVPLVALSASLEEGEKGEARSYCDAYLRKPVDLDHFPAQVLEIIEAGRTGGGEAEGPGKKKAGSGVAAAREASEALETLERLRSTLSHDIRTPLTVIISYGTTVAKEKAGPLNEKQKEMLDILLEHGYKMDDLISELARLAQETLNRYHYPKK